MGWAKVLQPSLAQRGLLLFFLVGVAVPLVLVLVVRSDSFVVVVVSGSWEERGVRRLRLEDSVNSREATVVVGSRILPASTSLESDGMVADVERNSIMLATVWMGRTLSFMPVNTVSCGLFGRLARNGLRTLSRCRVDCDLNVVDR